MKKYKLFLFTCFGGCATGAAASKALLRIWEENPEKMKVACLPAVPIPAKAAEIRRNAEKRLLVDACALRCGKKLFDAHGMTADSYIELTSRLKEPKVKRPASRELEETVYALLKKEAGTLLKARKSL